MTCTADETPVYTHSPGADLDYGFNWRENQWLETGETVAGSQWSVAPDDMALSRLQILNGEVTSVFAAGGTKGRSYILTNTITTSAGRTDSRTITLNCKTR